jgi:predicted short-subunit dehydrogenase-like oxidoreductase (DUF2520 family)
MRRDNSRLTAKKALPSGHGAGVSVAIVGLGRWGSALALALHAAGVSVAEVAVRGRPDAAQKRLARAIGAPISSWNEAELGADLIWLCVADGEIAGVAAELASRWRQGKRPRVVLHSSGVLGSDVLAPVQKLGVAVGSAHPFRSFPQRAVGSASLRGVFFGVEGEVAAVKAARALISRMGGEAFSVDTKNKALYHAFGSLSSGLLVTLLAAAEHAGGKAGIAPKSVAKLVRSLAGGTFANWHKNGAAASFSGPIVRGDAETIRLHLASLQGTPELEAIYRALTGYAIEHLPGRNNSELRALLGEKQFAKKAPGAKQFKQQREAGKGRVVNQSKRGRG